MYDSICSAIFLIFLSTHIPQNFPNVTQVLTTIRITWPNLLSLPQFSTISSDFCRKSSTPSLTSHTQSATILRREERGEIRKGFCLIPADPLLYHSVLSRTLCLSHPRINTLPCSCGNISTSSIPGTGILPLNLP